MKKFAVFDIDGTIFRFALFHSIVDQLVLDGFFSEETANKIEQGRKSWRTRSHPEAFWDYVETSVDAYFKSIKDLTQKQFKKVVDEVFDREKDHVYVYTRELIKDFKQKSYTVIAISGSQMEIVEKFARYYGFDKWVGNEYEVKNGHFTGNISGSHKDKHHIIKQLITEHDLDIKDSYGVGDTDRDITMLESVANPIAFNPNQQLFDHAKKNGWKIVVERKNVIYELGQKGESYILA